ncbi:hypothetical protein EU527_08730 [Candidatus Thorarchaeota archaeon]|nr:MAG: hypothetical protein EU527_08730 [Candidatus Thorarchaeota archaeon]
MIEDLMILLRHDLMGSTRIKNVKGKRSERRSLFRRTLRYIAATVFAVAVFLGILLMVDLLGWTFFETAIRDNIAFGATIFNFLVIISFMGSIAISVTTVANSSRMEYLMTMPISLRTLFLEKSIVIIFYNATLYLVIGTPIVIGLAIASTAAYALLSIPVFLVLLLANVTLGVSLGGLIGLGISRLLAGRRRLKQIGWFFGTAISIIIGSLYYYSIISSGSGFSQFFGWILSFAQQIGLSSDFSPGGVMNTVTLGLIVALPVNLADVILALVFLFLSGSLIYANAVVSENAHYSGWLASGSKRTSKSEERIVHTTWNPSGLPFVKMNETTSVSMWYNIASVRREGRVLANYLLGPLRIVFWFFIIFLTPGQQLVGFAPFVVIYAMIPFAVSYGVYFAGYELVYEGKNLMNLQLAPASLTDYIKGKVFSAVPFTIIATSVASVLVLFIQPSLWLYLPAIVLASTFLTVASGGIAAYSAATGGDFKAERNISRQRGSAVQMPIRSMWAMARAQVLPNLIGFMGIGIILSVGIFLNPIYTYLAIPVFALLCIQIMRSYTKKAGRRLQTIEATEYL